MNNQIEKRSTTYELLRDNFDRVCVLCQGHLNINSGSPNALLEKIEKCKKDNEKFIENNPQDKGISHVKDFNPHLTNYECRIRDKMKNSIYGSIDKKQPKDMGDFFTEIKENKQSIDIAIPQMEIVNCRVEEVGKDYVIFSKEDVEKELIVMFSSILYMVINIK